MDTSEITHVLIFSGEVPEVVLCASLDEVKKRVGDAFLLEDELREQFNGELDSDDNWSLDESGNRFCFTTGIGELETVSVYVVSKSSPANNQ